MNFLKIRKSGLFYETFDDDAKILHYLFGYKIISGRCAFPTNAITKVLNTLEDKKISYEICGDISEKRDFKKKNNYGKCLVKAENKLEIATLANKLTLKLESLSDEKLYNTLKKLSEFIDAE